MKIEKESAEKTAGILKSEKESIETEVIKSKSTTKFIVLAIIVSAIIDIVVFFVLWSMSDIPVYVSIVVIVGLLGVEAKVVMGIPKRL